MTKDELLKPRFKMIADFPGCVFDVGEVLECSPAQKNLIWHYEKYPHLFRKLEWWEGRKEKDFPLFANSNGNYITVRKWVIREGQNDCYAESGGYCHFRATPIDESEYNEYMRKSEKQI